ncbi:MAG TPA: MarR family transcriptional regulator [Solirubrobacteraceae bacterium]|nr:MarR family transcriptional regulator [Solirubrobacteraceae bacterium]
MSRRKRDIFEQLLTEVRGSQNATARFDQAVADAAGLNRTDMRIIDVLDREGAVTAGRLADVTGLSSGAMTTALDRLERSGHARRVRDAGDRRRVLVELTEAAQATNDFYSEHAAYAERLYQRHSLEQLELLLSFVRESREFNERRAAELEEASRGRSRQRRHGTPGGGE